MEQTINKFPKYCPGQFLSSDNLNESFNYLEEQERLSRSKLLGYGISEGLTCTCDSNKGTITITIHPGSAVTADGYLIDFPKAITYNYMASYQSNMINYDGKFLTQAYLLYETKQEIESFDQKPLTISFNPKEYTLGIIVETKEEKSVKCNQKSCNVNNSNIIITYRPVLIRKYIPEPANLKEMNIFPTPLTDVKTNRLQKIIESRDLNVLSRKTQTLYHNNESLIVKALNGLSTTVNTQILNKEAKIAFTKYFSKPISKLGDFNYELSIMNKECPYCLLFLEDVKTAINEFVVFYNDYSKNYSFYTNIIQKDKLIILGDGTSNDKYRNIFRYACSDQRRINDCNIVSNLFIRIPKLIESFAGRNISNTVRLIPARDCSSKLEERPIPYYYDSTIRNFWKTCLPGTTPAAYHYFNFNPEFLSIC
ncbi:hypothetical protein FACS1894177_06680 [Bacteroidia bacterium]|nr:hypothetical protein FACS1894177_06680 [Bacteroidia bacterium]